MPVIIPPEEDQVDIFGRPFKRSLVAPIIQPTQQAPIVPPVSQPIQQPSFSPVAELPEQAAYRQAAAALPQRSDFHNSKLRTILNAIGGGLAGAAGHPEVGTELRDAPYTQALADYQRRVQAAKIGSDIATGRQVEGVKSGSAQSLDASRSMQARAAETRATTGQSEEERKRAADVVNAKHKETLDSYTKWKMVNPKLDDLQFIYSLPDEDQPDAIKILKEKSQAGQKTPKQIAADTEARTTAALKAQDTPLGRRVAGSKAAASTEGRLAGEASQVTYEMSENYQELAKGDPASAAAALKSMPQGARMKLLKQAGIPATLPAKSQERMLNSKITLNHVNSAMQMATDPDIAKLLGPISGRIEIIKGKAGTGEPTTLDYTKALENLQPDQARKMGEFLNFLNYMVVWESTTLSGTRPAQRLIETLKETGARASMSQDRLLGSLDAIKRSVNNTMEAIIPGSSPDKNKPKDPFDTMFENMKVRP